LGAAVAGIRWRRCYGSNALSDQKTEEVLFEIALLRPFAP
jgi:hypothetical protein